MKIMEILVKDAVILNLGVQTKRDVLAEMSPNSARSLVLRRDSDWLAAGKATVDIREKGQCRLK